MMSVLNKYYRDPLYRNSIAIMLNTASSSVFGLLFWIIAAHMISAKDIGLATTAMSAGLLIITLSKLGMDNGLIRFLPKSENKSDLYSTTLIVVLLISVIMTIVFLAGLDLFSPSLGFLRNGWFPLLFIIYIALTSINISQNTAFIALRKGDLSLIQNLLLGIRIPVLFIFAASGVVGIFIGFTFAYLLSFAFGLCLIYRMGVMLKPRVSKAALKETLGFSLGNYTASIFSIAPITILPVLIVNTIGAENGAYFYIAYTIASFLFMIPSAICTSLFVEGSHNLPLKENVIKSAKLIMLILVPSIVVFFLFGDKILLLFSKEFSVQSLELLKLLALSSVFSAIISVYLTIKRVQKNLKAINALNLTISVLLIGLGYLSMKVYGLPGVGYVWLALNAAVCICVLFLLIKYDHILPDKKSNNN